ncbi:g10123 [Coccomyxa elongata]
MITDPKKKRSARTVQLTLSNLRRLQERGFDFADPEKVAARLREAHKPSTARTYISALINYLSASGEHPAALREYRKELVRLEKEIGIDHHKAAFTDRQKEQLVGWEDILAHRDALEPDVNGMALPLKGRALKKMYDHPLLSFYTLLAPARNEYRMLRIVDAAPKGKGAKEENFYVKGEQGDELILHRYKTAKHYGSAKVPVPADLRKAVHGSLELQPREFVSANFAKPSTPWTTQYMSNRMGAVLPDKKLGSALLRKIAITEFAKRGKGSKEALAKAMRHKLETSEHFYNDHGKGEEDDMFNLTSS